LEHFPDFILAFIEFSQQAMDADSVSMEAQTAIDKLRKDSIAEPVTQSDNGSSFIAMEFRMVLKQNSLTQNIIRTHT
jgi:hypothetical protein